MNKNNILLSKIILQARKSLPRGFYISLRGVLEIFAKMKNVFLLAFSTLLFFIPNEILKRKKKILLAVGNSDLGAVLVTTSLLKDFPQKEYEIIIYHNNEDIFKNLPYKKKFLEKSLWNTFVFSLLIHSPYLYVNGGTRGKISPGKKLHSIEETIFLRGLEHLIPHSSNKPHIIFDQEESKKMSLKFKNLISKKYSLVISENNYSGWSRVKNWGYLKMQKVIKRTPERHWVQVGMPYDKKLDHILEDLRGKTTVRELLFLASHATLILTTEGLLTHVSAAFNIPCVTIFPGFLQPKHSMYPNIIPVKPDQSIECLYCWNPNCPYEKPICLESISPKDVIDCVNKVPK